MFWKEKKPEVPKEDVVFTEIEADKNGRYRLRLIPNYTYVTLTEARLETILTKLKELNANVPISR